MPLQNRVDPFGNIVAHPARGLLMGNRGCLHDDMGRVVRHSDRSAWITCLPSWPGIRRQLMAPGHYTELFFLDEVTAQTVHPLAEQVPDGAILDMGGMPVLQYRGRWLEWSFDGYTPIDGPAAGHAITSSPMLAVLRAGYMPVLHGSAIS